MKKKFLVLGFLLLLSACTAPVKTVVTPRPATTIPSGMPATLATPTLVAVPIYSDPITGFFRSLTFLDDCTPATAMRLSREAEAWQDEVSYIYATLQENASPALQAMWGVDLEQVEANYLKFVSAQATAEAYLNFTDAFGDEAGGYGEYIGRGTGFNGGECWYRAELLAWQARAWYETFTWPKYESTLEYYQFDPQKTLDYLDESGIRFTVDDYTVDAQQAERLDLPDNPIDEWAKNRLYVSGITLDMSIDAALECEIWEKELLHTYDLLIDRATPNDEAPRIALENARDALLAFAPDYGVCVALYEYSETFTPELWQEHPDILYPGSAAKPERAWVRGDCYHWVTLRLRELLSKVDRSDAPPPWFFDPAEYEGRSAQEQRDALE